MSQLRTSRNYTNPLPSPSRGSVPAKGLARNGSNSKIQPMHSPGSQSHFSASRQTSPFLSPARSQISVMEDPLQPHPRARSEFDAATYVTDEMSESQVHIYRQSFDLMDARGEGWLNPGKIRSALRNYCDIESSIETVYQIYADFDSDMNGKIDFDEFISMMHMQPYKQDQNSDIEKVFHDITQYRDDGKGLTPLDLVALAADIGDTLSLADATAIIKKFDPQGKSMSLADFIKFNKAGGEHKQAK